MKKIRLLSLLLVLTILVGMIPMAAMAASKTASSSSGKTRYVKTSNGLSLNVRSSRKTHTDNIIAHLDYGTKVTLLREYGNSWGYITWGSGASQRGYVVLSALSSKKPTSTASKVYKYTTNPDSNYVMLRSSMKSHTNNVITSIRTGTRVTLIDTYSGGWSKVVYGKYTGYIQSHYLTNKK